MRESEAGGPAIRASVEEAPNTHHVNSVEECGGSCASRAQPAKPEMHGTDSASWRGIAIHAWA
eukprot:15413616-Alexandrium_andersonii.AAC.1